MTLQALTQPQDTALQPPLVRKLVTSGGPVIGRTDWQEASLTLTLDGEAAARAGLAGDTVPTLTIDFRQDTARDFALEITLVIVEAVFSSFTALDHIRFQPDPALMELRGLPFLAPSEGSEGPVYDVYRSGFYQTDLMWLAHTPAGRLRTGLVPGPDGRDHPLRPPHPAGLCYERYDPVADVTVSFRTVDVERDLDRFHRWMNDQRVAYFWELDQPKEELKAYLEAFRTRPHSYPLIGCFDGEEAGYFETYWVREDRLGPFYDSQPYDRGWHGLIGERKHLGKAKTGAWLRGLAHYLFLDCPMTENIMGEPRVDNAKLLAYADSLAYEKVKEFDFPHKRSALMRCPRSRFFSEVRL